ncbi:hypothetical protein [Mycolicibacterium sp. XJ1819]
MHLAELSVRGGTLSRVGEVFLGSEALVRGDVTEHELRRWYRPIFRDVYLDKRVQPSLRDRTTGAWLRTRRDGVIAGAAASALHGASWVEPDIPIEVISSRLRRQDGLIVRTEMLASDEITWASKLPVTTRERTAFDLGRYLPREEAVARLDALMRVREFAIEDVLLLANRHSGARGLKSLRRVLPLVDGGADSPRETWLRLLYIDAGLPAPTTQIPVVDAKGRLIRMLDMGWEDYLVGSEYDGSRHQTERRRYVKDARVMRTLRAMGWIVDQVIKEDRPDDIVARAREALLSRGWRPD